MFVKGQIDTINVCIYIFKRDNNFVVTIIFHVLMHTFINVNEAGENASAFKSIYSSVQKI